MGFVHIKYKFLLLKMTERQIFISTGFLIERVLINRTYILEAACVDHGIPF